MKSYAIAIFIFGVLLTSCKTTKVAPSIAADVPLEAKQAAIQTGRSSGMTRVNDSTFVVVYDVKTYKPKAERMGLIQVSKDGFNVFPIHVDYWGSAGIASDLESICKVPGRVDEFLLAESADWQGKLGRVFHVRLAESRRTAKVLSVFKLPLSYENDFGKTGDQYEGIHCMQRPDGKYTVLLAERGGSAVYPEAVIRWGTWDIDSNRFTLSEKGRKGIKVDAPGNWVDPSSKRSITDLYVDGQGMVWAAASDDEGDFGPFYSIIYKLGRLSNTEIPIIVEPRLKVAKEVIGFKIESLAGPAKGLNSTHSFGTEDEDYGGVWRPIRID